VRVTKKKTIATVEFEHDFLFLRTADANGRSSGGFQWPIEAGGMVEAPDWNPEPVCGGGLHGISEGLGDWEQMKDPCDTSALWYVCGAKRSEAVDIDCKIKVPRCRVLYVGGFSGAMRLISPVLSAAIISTVKARLKADPDSGEKNGKKFGAASATGDRGAASATGYSGVASATGDRGVASATGGRGAASATGGRGAASATGDSGVASATGDRGVASATGYSGAACATGDSGVASATGYSGVASATGYSGAASATGYSGAACATGDSGVASATGDSGVASATGDSGVASATGDRSIALAGGRDSRGMVGPGCLLVLVERDNEWNIIGHFSALAGERGVAPGVWYTLVDGQLTKVVA
jgi:hypothetical protein